MCQCRFIDGNKCTLSGGGSNWGGEVHVGAGGIQEISVPFTQFYCEPKMTLINLFKHKIYVVYIIRNTSFIRRVP